MLENSNYSERTGVKTLIFLIVLVVILASLPIVVASNTSVSVPDNEIPGDEIATNQTQASNSSVSGTITITWTTAPNG